MKCRMRVSKTESAIVRGKKVSGREDEDEGGGERECVGE